MPLTASLFVCAVQHFMLIIDQYLLIDIAKYSKYRKGFLNLGFPSLVLVTCPLRKSNSIFGRCLYPLKVIKV